MLPLRQLLPPLTLRTTAGSVVRAWDFKQKRNLVIAFLHAGCLRCEGFVRRLADGAEELAERNAVALVVLPETPSGVLAEALPSAILLGTELSGRAARAYLGEEAFSSNGLERVGVFVVDRYGELFAQWVAASEEGLPAFAELRLRLTQIEIACEGCGISEWPREG
jgi:peroxiredoxin